MPELRPLDALPNNGFVLSIPGVENVRVDTLSEIRTKDETFMITDGQTGNQFPFRAGLRQNEPLTLTRVRDGSETDAKFQKIMDDAAKGKKITFTIRQYRFGKVVLKISVKDFTANEFALSEMALDGTDPAKQELVGIPLHYDIKYGADARA